MGEELKEEVEVPGGGDEVVKKKRVKHGGRQKTYLTPEALQEHIKEYARNYYHAKVKEELSCPFCNTPFTNQSNLTRHLNKSKFCERVRQKCGYEHVADKLGVTVETNNEV